MCWALSGNLAATFSSSGSISTIALIFSSWMRIIGAFAHAMFDNRVAPG
jgi:hypothetical protein